MTQIKVLDFMAEWCQPCQALKKRLPVLENEIKDIATIETIDVDTQPELAKHYNIRSIPTLIIMNNNEEVTRFVGAVPLMLVERTIKEIHRDTHPLTE